MSKILVGHVQDLYKDFIGQHTAKVSNPMQVPKLKFISLNVGCGKFHKDANRLDYIESELDKIAGQKCVRTKIKKSISNFSIREGMIVGMKATLRRQKMFDFLTRLIMIAIPRMQDFNGISERSFDSHYNLNFGIERQDIFPEADGQHLFGMNVCIGISAQSKEEAIELLQGVSLPIIIRETKEEKEGGVRAA